MLAKTPFKSFLWLALMWGLVAPSCLLAEESAGDPTAAITAFQLMYRWNDFNGIPGSVDQHSFVLQPIIPWKLGNRPHIARITAPFVLSSPDWNAGTDNCSPDIPPPNYIPCSDKSGLGDIAAVDFTLFNTSAGRFGVGPVVVLPTGKDELGSGKWQLGPAAVFIGKTPKVVMDWGRKGSRVFVDNEYNLKDSDISTGTTIRLFVVPMI